MSQYAVSLIKYWKNTSFKPVLAQCRYSTLNRWEDKDSFAVHSLTNILHNYKCVGAACWEDVKVTGISVCLSESLKHTAYGLSLVALKSNHCRPTSTSDESKLRKKTIFLTVLTKNKAKGIFCNLTSRISCLVNK